MCVEVTYVTSGSTTVASYKVFCGSSFPAEESKDSTSPQRILGPCKAEQSRGTALRLDPADHHWAMMGARMKPLFC